jgi:hypothetical protein
MSRKHFTTEKIIGMLRVAGSEGTNDLPRPPLK